MKRKLTLREIKQLQIQMLEYFDIYCRKNDIPYYLSYGTLLGAIRHKGYIPWDDDVDVMIPRPAINKLVNSFNDSRYKIISVDTDSTYDFPYPRIVDTHTSSRIGLVATSYGINIDIYPIDAYPNDTQQVVLYRKNVKRCRNRRLMVLKWTKRLLRYLPIPRLPIVKCLVKKHEQALASANYDNAEKVHVFQLETEPLDKSLFDERVEVEFEGHMYYAPKNWDKVLTNWYGDYMKLPPEDKRHPYHATTNIYLKLS